MKKQQFPLVWATVLFFGVLNVGVPSILLVVMPISFDVRLFVTIVLGGALAVTNFALWKLFPYFKDRSISIVIFSTMSLTMVLMEGKTGSLIVYGLPPTQELLSVLALLWIGMVPYVFMFFKHYAFFVPEKKKPNPAKAAKKNQKPAHIPPIIPILWVVFFAQIAKQWAVGHELWMQIGLTILFGLAVLLRVAFWFSINLVLPQELSSNLKTVDLFILLGVGGMFVFAAWLLGDMLMGIVGGAMMILSIVELWPQMLRRPENGNGDGRK